MWIALSLLAGLLLVVLVYLLSFDGRFRVERSREIAAPTDRVFAAVADLRTWLAERLPEGPWLYPEDQIADLPMRMIAAEITREKLTLRLHQELPYQLTVETEQWQERKDGSVRIEQVIYVARPGHRGIALGPKGQTIKQIGMAARQELEEFLGREVHLFLDVRVREKWQDEAERYEEMGLDFSEGE